MVTIQLNFLTLTMFCKIAVLCADRIQGFQGLFTKKNTIIN